MKKELTESLEKYLYTIYKIVKENHAARIKDVSSVLNVGGPAASEAVKTLAEKGFINYVPYGIITMTKKGEQKALEKIKRYNIVQEFMEKILVVDKDKINVSSIEYAMTDEVFSRFTAFLDFMQNCTCATQKWMSGYKNYLKNGKLTEECSQCAINGNSQCCNKN